MNIPPLTSQARSYSLFTHKRSHLHRAKCFPERGGGGKGPLLPSESGWNRQWPGGDLLLAILLPARADSPGLDSWPATSLGCHFLSTPYSTTAQRKRGQILFVYFSLCVASILSGGLLIALALWAAGCVSTSPVQIGSGPICFTLFTLNHDPRSYSYPDQKSPFSVWWLHSPDKVRGQIDAYYRSCQRRNEMSLDVWSLDRRVFSLIIAGACTTLHHAYILLWEEAICINILLKWGRELD